MDDNSHVVDHGQDEVRLVYAINTSDMKKGNTRSMHIQSDHLREAAGITHIDLLNPHEIEIQTESTAGKLGVTLTHDEKRKHKLSTASRAVFVDGETNIAEGYHSVSSGSGMTDVHKLKMEPTLDQTVRIAKLLPKRVGDKWKKIDTSHITAGVYTTNLPGHDKRYLVSTHGDDGTQNAMHQLLETNKNNPKLLGGKHFGTKLKSTTVKGKHAYVLNKADFLEAKERLHETLTTKSPFQHGLAAYVTKLDDRTTSPHPSYVHVKIKRRPFHPTDGLLPTPSLQTTNAHIAALTGSTKDATIAETVTVLAPGFEDVVGKNAAFDTRAEVKPYTDDDDNASASTQTAVRRYGSESEEDEEGDWPEGDNQAPAEYDDDSYIEPLE